MTLELHLIMRTPSRYLESAGTPVNCYYYHYAHVVHPTGPEISCGAAGQSGC